MRILTVIPIARGIPKDTLTYFTKKDATVGSIVSIPLRNKTIYGLVTDSKVATEIKAELKSLSYSIKKIDNIETHSFLSDFFIQSCRKIADYYATSVGAALSALIPNGILEASEHVPYVQREKPSDLFYETALLQSSDEERYAAYRSLIREEFAKNRSVFFCLPAIEDLLNAKATLEKGIEKYTHTLHSGLTKKETLSEWQKIVKEEHPVLIIGTGHFLSLPRDDMGTIILEKESSRGYKMQSRPFLDIRTVAEILAKEASIRLVLGDMFLRAETLWKEKNGDHSELAPLKFRSLSTASTSLVDMRSPADMKKKEFSILGDELKNLLAKNIENNEHIFLFCGRKGLHPLTLCSDCGTIVVCKNCNAPVVLYGSVKTQSTAKKNLFVCQHCGERRDAHELCAHCRGWRLLPLGIGIEGVEQEVKSLFPKANVCVMDKDHVSTHRQAVKMRESFYNTPGSILLGTEMALPYLNQKIENAVVVSLDSLFSIPDFRINEKVFHIVLALRALAEKHILVQTRREDTRIFDYALRGNLMDFYRDEIEERKTIGYPPFTTYIKISLEGEKAIVRKQMTEIAEFLKPYECTVFDAFSSGRQSKFTVHGLVAVPQGAWVDKILLEKLRALSPSAQIKIDPDTLL